MTKYFVIMAPLQEAIMVRIFCTILLFVSGVAGATQTAPTFEVASVRRAAGDGPPGHVARNMDPAPGSFAMRNVPLRMALEWAYDLKRYQIIGPPLDRQ